MASPDRHGAQARVRPLGEDAPTWLTVGFAAIGLLVAGAAAWLALSAQPAQQAVRSDAPTQQAATSAAAAAPGASAAAVPARESRADDAANAAAAPPPTPPATAAASPAAPATAPPGSAGQPALSSAQPTNQDTCPPPVHIPFKLDSATPLTKDVQMDIEQLQAFMNWHSDARLSVEGHADAMGAEDYNLLLSYRRAKAAVALLGRAGLPEARMAVRAAGNAAPMAGVPGASERNRRVVLQVVGIDACQPTRSGSRQ
ncbi:MAG: OmpA family protein [Sterolibacteriaceae bacterium]|nr:OmpA family protein [Candidatus Methylophosphatis haderslevensis]